MLGEGMPEEASLLFLLWRVVLRRNRVLFIIPALRLKPFGFGSAARECPTLSVFAGH